MPHKQSPAAAPHFRKIIKHSLAPVFGSGQHSSDTAQTNTTDGITALNALKRFHYGWVIVFAGMLSIFACLGLARFALGMLLPAMGKSLQLSYDQMGFISTGNFVGYLIAVIFCGAATRRIGARGLIFCGLLLVAISMVLVSFSHTFVQVLLLYCLTGIGSGAVNVPVMALVSHWFARSTRGTAAGLIVVGSGLAMIFSGIVVPQINLAGGAEGWRTNWLLLGAISLVIALISGLLQRNDPRDLGLNPVGADSTPNSAATPGESKPDARRGTASVIAHLGMIYFAFGFTYVVYATFFVTTLVAERGFSEREAGYFWAVIGLLSLVSGPVFGALSDQFGRKSGLVMVFAFQLAAYLLVALELPGIYLNVSIALYGLVAWSVPTIMAAAVGDYLGPQNAARAFAIITLFFGAGQIVGPGTAGLLAEQSGSFVSSYLMSAAVVGAAIVLTLLLRRPHAHE